MKKYAVQPLSFRGYFELGILTGAKAREGMKNKLDPRHSEPNRLSASRVKSRLCMDLSLSQ